jgi:glucose-6-phosphate isomerase
MAMIKPVVIDFSNTTDGGSKLLRQVNAMTDTARRAFEGVETRKKRGELGFYSLPFQRAEKEYVKEAADRIIGVFDNLVVVGIGGSALGNRFLHRALNHHNYNLLSREARGGRPRVFVADSIDPVYIKELLDVLDIKRTIFNIITKSGNTAETMANYLVIRSFVEKAVGSKKVAEHIIATTDRERGSLVGIARREGYPLMYIPANVGGRYSVLSPVGMLSAAVTGIDIDQLLEGAAFMEKMCRMPQPSENPALLGAMLQYIAYERGKRISVVMPYSDSLDYFGDWYCQLWAESLGKTVVRDGKTVSVGQTPLKAVGVKDQHSLLQLFLDGPDDKVFTFISVEQRPNDYVIPAMDDSETGIGYLMGKGLCQLLEAEFNATRKVMTDRGLFNYTVKMPNLSAHSVGQLVFLYMLMTAYMGELLGVNPFDQPAVEEGKKITYRLMGREGY